MTSTKSSMRVGSGPLSLRIATVPLLVALIVMCGLAVAAENQPKARAADVTYEFLLLSSSGEPASAARVRIMGVGGELPEAVADQRGRVNVAGLAAGDPAFFLAVSRDGREKMFMPVLAVPEGDQRVTLRLWPPCEVRGELLDEVGNPVPGVPVYLSGYEWLGEPELEGCADTNEAGRFQIDDAIAGAYYTAIAVQGPAEKPTRTWRSETFRIVGWDGWYETGILLPEGSEPSPVRPSGQTLVHVASDLTDQWYDVVERGWRPAKETFDPNRAWAPAPEDAMWVWRAGRPDPQAERYGATVEFRRIFTVPATEKPLVGYLTVAADDYAAIRLNGHWVGHTNQYMRTVNLLVPGRLLRAGENELRFTVRNIPSMRLDFYNPTGYTYTLDLIALDE
ncbi:MAG: hypothetical protein JXA57_13615 [Armatimonadetes bacterium]|nr:hypothetical protein [Armatimonadota bacterium]